MALLPGLYNSIHSSLELALVPDQAISLIMMDRLGAAVEVGVIVPVCVGVRVIVLIGVFEGVNVIVGVNVLVGVFEGVNVSVGVNAIVGVGVMVGVSVTVGVRVAVPVSVGVVAWKSGLADAWLMLTISPQKTATVITAMTRRPMLTLTWKDRKKDKIASLDCRIYSNEKMPRDIIPANTIHKYSCYQ